MSEKCQKDNQDTELAHEAEAAHREVSEICLYECFKRVIKVLLILNSLLLSGTDSSEFFDICSKFRISAF